MTIFHLVPVVVILGIGLYYLNILRKGKAAGGGFMAGVQAHHREKWQELLEPDEQLSVWGSGVLWRPWWQYWLASQLPLLRLVWPVKMYQMILTDRGRLLMGTYSTMGSLSDKKRYERGAVTLAESVEEKPGLAMKLNPLVPKDYKTFEATLGFPDASIRLCTVPSDFVAALKS